MGARHHHRAQHVHNLAPSQLGNRIHARRNPDGHDLRERADRVCHHHSLLLGHRHLHRLNLLHLHRLHGHRIGRRHASCAVRSQEPDHQCRVHRLPRHHEPGRVEDYPRRRRWLQRRFFLLPDLPGHRELLVVRVQRGLGLLTAHRSQGPVWACRFSEQG